jgi:GntR family transcriptional repressor for pyruvate dehydrogenase complex
MIAGSVQEGEQMAFPKIGAKDRLVDRVVDELQNMIVSGELQPGTRFPPERALAEQLGVSRTVAREAVRILDAKGLVETKRGVGTTVRRVTKEHVVEPLIMLLQTQEGGISVEHLHQVRRMLEIEIAGIAALRASDTDLEVLQTHLRALELTSDDPVAYSDEDTEFHNALAKSTHNPLLRILLGSIRDLMHEVRHLVTRYPHLIEETLPDHRLILDKIMARDPEGAREAMELHLEHARQIQEAVLLERGADDDAL